MSSVLAKNTLFMTAASVAQKLVAFVYFLFVARILMPEQTGVYFLITSLITMFSVVTDLGLTSVVIRDFAKSDLVDMLRVRQVIGLKLGLMTLGLFVVVAASMLLNYTPYITRGIWITTVVLILDAMTLLLYGILRAKQQLRYEAFGMFFTQLMTSVIGGIILVVHPTVYFLLAALISGSFVNLFLSMWFVSRVYGWRALVPRWDKQIVRTLVRTMLPFGLAGIFVKLYSSLDIILISKMMDAVSVGIYSVVYKFTYAFQFIPLAFAAALYPNFSATVERDVNATNETLSKAIWYIFFVATPVVFGIWLVAPEMVQLAGHGYVEAIPLLRALIFVLFPSFLEIPFGALLNAAHLQKVRMWVIGGAVIFNALLDIALIPQYGLFGAVVGALVSYSLMVVVEYVALRNMLSVSLSSQAIRSIAATILSGILMFVVGWWIKPFVPLIVMILVSAIVYGGFGYGVGAIDQAFFRRFVLRKT